MANPTTQEEVDAARVAMFAAFDTRQGATLIVQSAQSAYTGATLAWQNAVGNLAALPAGATQLQIDAAKQAVEDTEAALIVARAELTAAQTTAAGAPAAFDAARAAYATAVNHLVNGT